MKKIRHHKLPITLESQTPYIRISKVQIQVNIVGMIGLMRMVIGSSIGINPT